MQWTAAAPIGQLHGQRLLPLSCLFTCTAKQWSAKRRDVRNRLVEPGHLQKARDEARRLPKRQVEPDLDPLSGHRQAIPLPAARQGPAKHDPGRGHRSVDNGRQRSTLTQGRIASRPVQEAIAGRGRWTPPITCSAGGWWPRLADCVPTVLLAGSVARSAIREGGFLRSCGQADGLRLQSHRWRVMS